MGTTKYDWTQADLLLGMMPDGQLGKKFGIPLTSVYRRRRSRGIPAYKKRGSAYLYEDIIGQVPDESLARMAGVSVETARKWRRSKGISLIKVENERQVQECLVYTLPCTYQEYVYTPYGLIDVLTADTIYKVKFDLSTEEAHLAIGELLSCRIEMPNHELVIACRRVTAHQQMIYAINKLGIRILALESRGRPN